MPSPSPGESRDDFVDRCMGDTEAVNDFPNEKQRFAFCNSKFQQKAAEDPRKTPAPPSDRKKGSKKNKKDSAKDTKGGITFSEAVINSLKKKVSEHNEKNERKVTLGMLKAVYRRGAGAYSTSHRPGVSRAAWSMARVNAFLKLVRSGKPSNPKYTQDNDLLPKGHPRKASENDTNIEKSDDAVISNMSCGCGCDGETDVTAAEYQGKKVTLNKPFRTPGQSKKFGVYTKNEKGNVVLVRFGDPNMEIKRDDPERRKNFRSRHNCDSPGPKWKARYWSCYQWRSNAPVKAGMEDYIFSTKEGAEKKSREIGFDGATHIDYMADGTPMYFPGPDEKTFQRWFDMNDSHDASEKPCGCHNTVAAEPTPRNDETHDEYMSRCEAMGYSTEECMQAHGDHKFKEEEVEVRSYHDDEEKYAAECPVGEEMVDGYCQPVAVELDLNIGEVSSIVEASTGKTIIRISGIAFHDGINKNGWGLTAEGGKAAATNMIGSDVTLYHPKPVGGRFTRNMDGGVEEAVVGVVTDATFNVTEDGWEVKYVAEVHREELFASLESGLYLRPDYGVSIGGTGIPVKVVSHDDGRREMFFGESFEFDHLAIVHRPAYPKANIEDIVKVEIAESEEMFNNQTGATTVQSETVISMTDEIKNETLEAELEAVKADMVLREARIAEFEAKEAARIENDRMKLVEKASELGLNGHEDFGIETLEKVIASWEASRPEPTPEPEVVEMLPATPAAPVQASVEASAPVSVVANYLNGNLVETEESLYERAWNSWASAYNRMTDKDQVKAPLWAEAKELI